MALQQRQLICDLELLRSQLCEDGEPQNVEELASDLVEDVLRLAVADISGVAPPSLHQKPPPALPAALRPYELHSGPTDAAQPTPPEASDAPTAAPRRKRPKAPKGKKRPNPALGVPQGQEQLSDRSGVSQQTALTTASSRHTAQTAASSTRQNTGRSSTSRASSKAGRRQRVVSSEERLESKYRDLEQLLQRDFASETARVCAESLREARQILHCTTAATRMVCGVVSEAQRASWSPAASRPAPTEHPLPTLTFSPCEEEPSDNEDLDAPRLSHRSAGRSARSEVEQTQSSSYELLQLLSNDWLEPKRPKQRRQRNEESEQSAQPKSFPSPEQTLVGYGVDVPKKSNKAGTDNQLRNTDNDLIRRWLKIKNRQTRQEKKMKRDEERLKREIDEELKKVDDKRQEESYEAYRAWKRQKERQIRVEKRQRSSERPLSPRPDAEGMVQMEGEEDEEEEEKKERRGPRPVHNYVFPRPTSPSHASVSPTRPPRPTRMRVRGEPLSGTQRPLRPEPSPVRLSYDDWLKRKRSESARRRKADSEKRCNSEAAMDPEMERIVPEMARQRFHASREAKRRVNSGLKPKPKVPRKPAEDGERKENGPPGSQPFEWRMERPLRRPQSAKATLAQPRGRRPDPCGTEHPGSAAHASKGTVLEEIVAAADEEEEEGRPVVPRLDLRGAFLTQGEN